MKSKTVFFCTECGNESPKWSGRCSACGAWNSMVEQVEKGSKSSKKSVIGIYNHSFWLITLIYLYKSDYITLGFICRVI